MENLAGIGEESKRQNTYSVLYNVFESVGTRILKSFDVQGARMEY